MPTEDKTSRQAMAVKRTGRDEMNLVEFPLSLMMQRTRQNALSFTRERTLNLPDGSTLQQSWMVTASPEFGLPQPVDEDVLLALLKIACESGFTTPEIHFTRCTLLEVLKWPNQGFYFKRIEQALDRLKSTTIKAKNAFWNNRTKAYETCHFGVIDSYKLFEKRDGHNNTRSAALESNWVIFSREFFSSLQAGYIKPLDLELYFSFNSSVSKRLFRYLDKKRYQKQRFEINISQLASVHLGLSEATCRYSSWIKKDLDRAHAELARAGFLRSAEYARMRNGEWKVCYSFPSTPQISEQLALPLPPSRDADLIDMLVKRGVSRGTARELVGSVSLQTLEAQIEVFDHLNNSGKPMKNPGGFLTQAIRNGWSIAPPGFVSREVREERARALSRAAADQADKEQQLTRAQQTIEQVRDALPSDVLEALRDEALAQARAQLGAGFRLRRDSRMVDAFFNGILQERYIDAPAFC